MIECEGCKSPFNEDELDEENLCEECSIEAHINRAESINDLD